MPRYTDTDLLIKKIKDLTIFLEFGQDGCLMRDIIVDFIDHHPSTSVIPNIKRTTINVDPNQLAEKMFEKKRIEFANEIFSAIDEVLVFKEDERRVRKIRKKYLN